jgi:hypothetical protein
MGIEVTVREDLEALAEGINNGSAGPRGAWCRATRKGKEKKSVSGRLTHTNKEKRMRVVNSLPSSTSEDAA